MRYLLLVIILVFGGCSYKNDYSQVSSKKTTEQGVANTKKVSFPKAGKPQIFVTITYLNSIDNRNFVDKNLEQFVVGIHHISMNSKNKHDKILLKDIKFDIDNSGDFVSVEKIKSNDKILGIIPASNPWSQYFLVQAPLINKNFINFSLEIDPYEKVVLGFEKDY